MEDVALTGWSRFDHYGPLCELFSAGIPSMALCLAVLDHGSFDENLHNKTSKLLGFSTPFQTHVGYFKKYNPEEATFKGSKLYTLVGELEKAIGWKEWAEIRLTGWTRPYNIKNSHLSFFQLNDTLHGLQESSKRLTKLKLSAPAVLYEYYGEETVDEWVTDKIDFHNEKIEETLKLVKKIIIEHFD